MVCCIKHQKREKRETKKSAMKWGWKRNKLKGQRERVRERDRKLVACFSGSSHTVRSGKLNTYGLAWGMNCQNRMPGSTPGPWLLQKWFLCLLQKRIPKRNTTRFENSKEFVKAMLCKYPYSLRFLTFALFYLPLALLFTLPSPFFIKFVTLIHCLPQ